MFHDAENFIVHVDYFPLDEIRKQFEELLRAYRDHELQRRSSTVREEDNDEEHDRTGSRRKADLARETFRASFRERLEQTPTLLSSMPFEQAVGMMVEWASQLLPRQGMQESFSTAAECSSRLRELTSDSDDSLPDGVPQTPWPFVQKLRVYLNAYILREGLIIADLPGLRDLNSVRQAITERYVRQCHQILVVARIDRAITDESIKNILDLATRANLSKIDIVCTRSEDVQRGEEARNDFPAERATTEEMQEAIETLEEEISSLKEDIEDFEQDFPQLSRGVERELFQSLRRAEKSKEKQEFELLCHLMRLRNGKVSDGLRKEHQSHPYATTMRTFCVSNEIYRNNWEKPMTAALPHINLSGIPELRRYCIGIVAESHLRATREFVQEEIPAFLDSVRLWVEAGSGRASSERRKQICDAVSAIQGELDEVCKSPSL
jgi:GTPase SAR1 family protein